MNVPLLVAALAVAVLLAAIGALIIKSPSKNRTRAHIAAGFTIIVISLPLAFWVTILLLPLWGGLKPGMESNRSDTPVRQTGVSVLYF
jgi:ABC-type arginine transport system permease subunit